MIRLILIASLLAALTSCSTVEPAERAVMSQPVSAQAADAPSPAAPPAFQVPHAARGSFPRQPGPLEWITPLAQDPFEKRISVDFRDTSVHQVFHILAETAGINIVLTPDVTGRVTLLLVDVPWNQVIELVARTAGLVIERNERVWIVRPLR